MKKTLTVLLSTAVVFSSAAALAKTDAGADAKSSVRFPSYVQINKDWCKYFAGSSFVFPGCQGNPGTPDYIPDTNVPETEAPETQAPEQTPNQNVNKNVEMQVLDLVNKHRAQNGLSALTWDDALANVARAHSEDMRDRRFFSHNNPDGLSPFDRIKNYGITYRSAGENIAAGQTTPEEVVNAWMNSPGHRANILNESYTKLGVGYASGGSSRHYWTQNFAG